MIRANEKSAPAEAETPSPVRTQRVSAAPDMTQSSVSQYVMQSRAREDRIIAELRMIWLLEDIFGRSPVVRNVAGRFRNADGADALDAYACPRCGTITTDAERCVSCGEHRA